MRGDAPLKTSLNSPGGACAIKRRAMVAFSSSVRVSPMMLLWIEMNTARKISRYLKTEKAHLILLVRGQVEFVHDVLVGLSQFDQDHAESDADVQTLHVVQQRNVDHFATVFND